MTTPIAHLPPRVPVFPLPTVVFFPDAVLPLHVFEPRYRQMVMDVLEGDRLITMALLKPGWEPNYEGNPPVFPLGCLGRIDKAQTLPDGRYNLALSGLCRVELLEEFEDRPYRTARVRALAEGDVPVPAAVADLTLALLASFTALQQGLEGAASLGPIPAGGTVPFPVLVNSLCLHADIEPLEKQGLLELPDAASRCRALTELLDERLAQVIARGEAKSDMPPGTLVN